MLLTDYQTVAHRGLHNKAEGIPENSLLAFQKAIEAKVAIEIDVHLTKDEKVIVFHDDNLKRMTGLSRPVEDCTWEDLKDLRLQGTSFGIPTLSSVLELVDGTVPLLIELKDGGFSGRLEEKLMEVLEGYKGKYMLQSFNPYVLYWLSQNAPEVLRGQLSQRDFEKEEGKEEGKGLGGILEDSKKAVKNHILGNLLFNGITKPDFIAYNIKDLKGDMVKRWRKKGYGVLVWTVKTEEELRKSRSLCCGAIFERLEVSAVKKSGEGGKIC